MKYKKIRCTNNAIEIIFEDRSSISLNNKEAKRLLAALSTVYTYPISSYVEDRYCIEHVDTFD